MFIATIVILLAGIIFVTAKMSQTKYTLAFTDLKPNDAANIKTYLTTNNIPFQLSADGKSIGVPESQAASVKLDVEAQGLNKNSSIGFGAFRTTSPFGTTDREFDVKYVDALQGELQQLIETNESISSSKVLISLPKDTVFNDPKVEQATAAVTVALKPGYQLNQAQVDTVYKLVSHSIKNLPVENITISDQYGQPLDYSKNGDLSTNLNAIGKNFDINNQFKNDLQRNITNLLGTLFDRDKVIVSVISTMNFDQVRSQEKLVTPPNKEAQTGLEISLQQAHESYTSDGGSTPSGVPGTGQTDVPSYPGTTNNGKTQSEKDSKIVNSEINRITNDIVATPYVVKDLSITVGIEPPIKDDPNSLTQGTKDAIQSALASIVRTALADNKQTYTDADLAKRVNVIPHAFATKASGITQTQKYLTYAAIGLAALLLGGAIVAIALARRRKRLQLEEEQLTIPAKTEYPSIDLESGQNENQVRKQLESLARRKPEDFVNLLRTWLVDE